MADERARERGLAGAKVARERDEIARLERAGDVDHQPAGGLLVGQHHREARTAGRGQEHGHEYSDFLTSAYPQKNRELPI